MSPTTEGHSSDPRRRAARTKRDRSRRALLDAAEAAFTARGWAGTRVEDVALAAGVSVATAYNHFPSKHGLMGTVFAPLVQPLLRQAERDLAADRPVQEALEGQVRALARLGNTHRALTATFTAAVEDYTIRVGRGPASGDDRDPRNLAPLPDALIGLIVRGQTTGELRRHPPAYEVAASVVNLLLLRSISRPEEPPDATAELLLTVLFGVLRPQLLLGGPDDRPFARPR